MDSRIRVRSARKKRYKETIADSNCKLLNVFLTSSIHHQSFFITWNKKQIKIEKQRLFWRSPYFQNNVFVEEAENVLTWLFEIPVLYRSIMEPEQPIRNGIMLNLCYNCYSTY